MSRYFSNGTEGYAWMAEWCDRCDKDHQAHIDHHEDACPIIARSFLLEADETIPEWVDNSETEGFTFPPAVHCLSFAPCQQCEPGGDDGCGWEPPTPPVVVHPDQATFDFDDLAAAFPRSTERVMVQGGVL